MAPHPDEHIAATLTRVEFMALVEVDPTTGCWLWTGPRDRDGYGLLGRGRHRSRAHRVALVLFHGVAIPPGKRGLHTCDNPPCCNPSHVYAGTQAQNMRDMVNRGRNVTRPPRGARSPHAKLTAAQVRRIRELCARGTQQKVLAARYGISPTQIHRIVKGERWAHVG